MQSFTSLFQQVDKDADGVITEQEFRELMSMMNVLQSEDEVTSLLHQIDPFNN